MFNTCNTVIIIVMRYINLNPKRSLSCFFLLFLILFLNISCKYNSSPYADVTLQTLLAPYDKSKLTPVDVVILSGQSNMAGSGIPEEAKQYLSAEEYTQISNGIDGVTIFTCNDYVALKGNCVFSPYSNVSFKNGSFGDLFGPEVGFALECKKAGRSLVLIKYSAGGMPMNHFLEDNDISRVMKGYILNCLLELVNKGYYPNIQAFCWMQGENDCDLFNANNYYNKECLLINSVRKSFNEKLLFIDARVTDWDLVDPDGHQDIVNKAKEKIAQEERLCYLIDSTGLKKNQFNIGHYDTPSTIELGRRFAREFLAHSEAGK